VKSTLNVDHHGFTKFKDYIRSFPQLEIFDEHTSSTKVRVRQGNKLKWISEFPDHLSDSDIVDIILEQGACATKFFHELCSNEF